MTLDVTVRRECVVAKGMNFSSAITAYCPVSLGRAPLLKEGASRRWRSEGLALLLALRSVTQQGNSSQYRYKIVISRLDDTHEARDAQRAELQRIGRVAADYNARFVTVDSSEDYET